MRGGLCRKQTCTATVTHHCTHDNQLLIVLDPAVVDPMARYWSRIAIFAYAVVQCLSICLSITFVDSVETKKYMFKKFSPPGSHTILVFPHNIPMGTPYTRFQMQVSAFETPIRGFPSKYCHNIWCGKTRMVWLPMVKNFWTYIFVVSTESTNVTDRRMDRHCTMA